MEHTNKFGNRSRRKFLFIPFFIVAAAFLRGYAVMLLWNNIIPEITGWSTLTYWKAVGLLVLCRILFGGFRGRGGRPGHRGGPQWRNRWNNMSEEEKLRMKEHWRKRCETKSSDK